MLAHRCCLGTYLLVNAFGIHRFTGTWQETFAAWSAIETPPDMQRLLNFYEDGLRCNDIGNLLGIIALALGMQDRSASEISDGTSVPAARLLIQTMAGCLGYLRARPRFE